MGCGWLKTILREMEINRVGFSKTMKSVFEGLLMILRASALLILFSFSFAAADDWPQWMGPGRDNVWRESGIIEKFP